jgi:adenine-specific DNA-methyltransferase
MIISLPIKKNKPEEQYSRATSVEHRKRFAQFFTPFPVAQFMAEWLAGNKTLHTVLDPAFGLGVFARALKELKQNCRIKGFEIDNHICEAARTLFQDEKNVFILEKDYMFNDWENKYDGIFCNPPYFKFHDYDNKNILQEIEEKIGLKLNGFTNLYTLFLLKSINQLNPNGRAAYIIPSEFLNSDYGKLVKKYLIQNKSLRYIIIVNFEENVFDDALTTASILLFSNDNNSKEIEFINIKTMRELEEVKLKIEHYPDETSVSKISYKELNPEIKWKAYYQVQNSNNYKHLVPFANFGKVVRGIATGSNDFFVFNLSKAKANHIGEGNLLPCICKSADVRGSFFTEQDFKKAKDQDRSVLLFNGMNTNDKAVKKYLQKGVEEEVDKRFLTACRNPWYLLENRPPSPIWVSVFNRKGLRFIRNEANIKNLTTFHCIYLNMFSALKVDLLFAYLLTDVSKQIFNDNCREYGNGLQKFEPNDINKANIVDINMIDPVRENDILKLYYQYRQSEIEKRPKITLLHQLNQIFIDFFTA